MNSSLIAVGILLGIVLILWILVWLSRPRKKDVFELTPKETYRGDVEISQAELSAAQANLLDRQRSSKKARGK